jgi:mono/diheme cytochrome c family protein
MRRTRLFLVLLGLSVLVACSDLGDDPADGGGPMDPPSEAVSFTDDIQPIFDANCVVCHGDGGNAGLDLRSGQSYTNLVGIKATESDLSRIEPGEPMNSWLYLKLTGQQDVGTMMPPTGFLDADLTDLVRTWIEEGALD